MFCVVTLGCTQPAEKPPIKFQRQILAEDVEHFLRTAVDVTVFSLEPDELYSPPVKSPDKTYFHWWVQSKSVVVTESANKAALQASLADDVLENWKRGADCFEPRHGLRLGGEGRTMYLVICYRCVQLWVFDESGERNKTAVGISDKTQAIMDRLLAVSSDQPLREVGQD
jgi:hypothetical protein